MASRGYFSDGVMPEQDALIAIGARKFTGARGWTQQTKTTNISLTEQDLIDWATTYTFPSDSGESMTLVSSNAADNQTIVIVGLDVNFEQVIVPVTLTGLTPVPVPVILTRVNLLDNISSTAVLGTISIASGANIYCQILPANQISTMGIYTSPAGKTTQILNLFASMIDLTGNTDTSVDCVLKFRPVGGVFKLGLDFGMQRRGTTSFSAKNTIPNAIQGPIDNKFSALATASGVNVALRISYLLQDI